jgi:hypothetical protein
LPCLRGAIAVFPPMRLRNGPGFRVAPGQLTPALPLRTAPTAQVFYACSFYGTDRRIIYLQTMMERPLADFDLEKAIALRWALRDILGNRLKLSPVKDDDLRTLIDLGFVEITDDSPVVTPAGLAALG